MPKCMIDILVVGLGLGSCSKPPFCQYVVYQLVLPLITIIHNSKEGGVGDMWASSGLFCMN